MSCQNLDITVSSQNQLNSGTSPLIECIYMYHYSAKILLLIPIGSTNRSECLSMRYIL